LLKEFYAGATERIEEGDQNRNQNPDPAGSQAFTVGTHLQPFSHY
jgi:hypothetical protein